MCSSFCQGGHGKGLTNQLRERESLATGKRSCQDLIKYLSNLIIIGHQDVEDTRRRIIHGRPRKQNTKGSAHKRGETSRVNIFIASIKEGQGARAHAQGTAINVFFGRKFHRLLKSVVPTAPSWIASHLQVRQSVN